MTEDSRRKDAGEKTYRTDGPHSPKGCCDGASGGAQNRSLTDGAGSMMDSMFAMMREWCSDGETRSLDDDWMRKMMQQCCDGCDASDCCEMSRDTGGAGKDEVDGTA